MPPEYEERFTVATVKGDLYSFGVLMLLEVAMGKRPNSTVDLNGESMSFLDWARVMVAPNGERDMLDANIWVWVKRKGLEEAPY
ncbi:Protein kinase-like domain containing protein [Parasponia andersonii]|uniref:Protein kinase-like domain containing protein n=1 Tax=Parasponia andersonii TaxID=3476 RepID=A0A2P5BV33_PARAD|nr:Protein kinase-like domain containing protein [Parasponia andersonii]